MSETQERLEAFKAIDLLSNKYSLSEREVKEIEDLPRNITPWQMTMRLVASRHVDTKGLMIGEKTVETIYRAWLKTHPESRKSTRLTIPAAERTL